MRILGLLICLILVDSHALAIGEVAAKHKGSAYASGTFPINLSGATIIATGEDRITISNVGTRDGKSNFSLQWNPYTRIFDVVATTARSTNAKCITSDVGKDGYFEIEHYPDTRTIEIRVMSKNNGAFYQAFVSYTGSGEFGGIIQSGKQLSLTTKPENINSSYALATFEPNYDGFARIPEGVTRTIELTRIPSWFDFQKSIQGIIWSSRTVRCL